MDACGCGVPGVCPCHRVFCGGALMPSSPDPERVREALELMALNDGRPLQVSEIPSRAEIDHAARLITEAARAWLADPDRESVRLTQADLRALRRLLRAYGCEEGLSSAVGDWLGDRGLRLAGSSPDYEGIVCLEHRCWFHPDDKNRTECPLFSWENEYRPEPVPCSIVHARLFVDAAFPGLLEESP